VTVGTRGDEAETADFSRAKGRDVDFSGADLTDASFAQATLTDVNLRGAKTTRTDWPREWTSTGLRMEAEQADQLCGAFPQ
jgi:uncharacterized protein YjbI with pentapeptide repeats